ncbi:MAG: ABC transporter ATP-binding protein [Deltaproteobacteria bacterium]|nr:ABC transporter ATP-binding protein [Deltaproteobacteria bacterium]MBW2085999.1 ABC transporter ATP-binding protein [Deltaproteobacteria bacterium]
MNIIEIENLSHRFTDGTLGVDNINLAIKQGEFVVIAGVNGSGKTTLLRHLNGLLFPDRGKVKLFGKPVSDNPAKARQTVGMIFQDADSQIVGETVYDDAAFGPENLGLSQNEVKRQVMAALKVVDLLKHMHQRPHTLSAGEKRRLAIAGILAMEPKILVFDEPFSNLDYPGIKQVLWQIISLHHSGHTILVSTHDIEKIIAHADRLIIMRAGRVVKDGPPQSLIKGIETFGVREPCTSRLGLGIKSWLS